MMQLLFVFIGTIVLVGLATIVLSKNVAHVIYALALTLIGIAGVYVLMNAELLAVVQIMIYAGGVVIFLSFGIMLTNRLRGEKITSESGNKILAAIVAIWFFSGAIYLIETTTFPPLPVATPQRQVEKIGLSFFTEHIVAFELIAFILLVALVGSSFLAKMSSDE